MKRILLVVALAITTVTFAQKEELKTLKKIYNKDTPSTKDLKNYKENLSSLQSLATEEGDKVYANFYKGMLPLLELANLGQNAKPEDQMKIFNPNSLSSFTSAVTETLEYEKKSGKKLYTDDINETLSWFKPMLSQVALQLNTAKKYKDASGLFYSIYKMDKSEGSNLENAAILAVQSEDFILAEKLYEEYKNSDYLNNGVQYFAINKATGNEDSFPNREAMVNMIAKGSHEKPKTEKVSKKKPEVYKMVALIASHNGKLEKAKLAINEALELNPNDDELKKEGARIYFNEAYEMLKDDQKLVDEINANRDNKAKYDELLQKRNDEFKKALPSFEKAYSLNPTDANTKTLLKVTYETLGMKDKAAVVK